MGISIILFGPAASTLTGHLNRAFNFLYLTPLPPLNRRRFISKFALMKISNGVAISFTFVFFASTALPLVAADPQSDSERLQNLEKAVRQLQERNAELEKEVRQLRPKSGPFAPILSGPEGKATAGNDNKAVFTATPAPLVDVHPGGAEYKLTLGGYLQLNSESGDVSAFEGRFGDNSLKDRFRLRRARVTLTGDFEEQFDFKVEGDFGQGDGLSGSRTAFSGTDIFVNWHGIPEANVRVGQFKAPFGLEWLTADTSIYTIERSLPTGAITQERQIGAMIWGKPLTNILPEHKDLVTYYAGLFNGNNRNITNNDNNEFMYVGRLELLAFKGMLVGQEANLKLGGDYFFSRDQTGTNISPYTNLLVNADGSLTPFTLANPDERHAWSADAWLKIGPFDLIGEYLDERVRPRTAPGIAPTFTEFEANGFYVLGGYFVIPKKLQAVVKWEHLNPGQRGNDGIQSITGGLNYLIHGEGLMLMANYVHTWSDFREANPQFGDDQFDEVLLRLQIIF
ncbi:MAG: phosphate-selective porin OprO and OprP [Verrucomicrobiota bacterium]|jgi:phosphate-selective porin